ncbi:MAG TPA: DUF4136 domain-containing protein [Geminicoccus sp.]|jgi:hypothetical protein|uniref:DUF4136 domain-containing protein n=1 Tax=Geminicoccus sp. TaxID=2024832 RepID=UPI002E32FDB5|nr:DUF4136 domain-containing protein [Geminicoccus sp.]HEX2525039.1 DUF4136 domain-containing protein [Geminicoccus sp.]
MRFVGRFLWVLLMVSLVACTREPVIRTDFDRTADFGTYRSFGFEPKLGTDPNGYSSLLTQRLKAAVSRELMARGYVEQAEAPDLLVNFHAGLQNKVRVTSTPPLWGPWPYDFYGYGDGFYGRWAGYGGWTDVQSYTLGTLNIDLIDRARRQLVWQGVAVSEIDDVVETAPSEEAVSDRVARIFAGYPFHAASR